MKWTGAAIVASIGLDGTVAWATMPGSTDASTSPSEGYCSLDVNRDGVVSADEAHSALGFGHAAMPRSARAGGHALAVDQFRSADRDRDGQLSRVEAEASLPALAERFDAYDLNRDGRLDSFEIHHGFMAHPPVQHRSGDVI